MIKLSAFSLSTALRKAQTVILADTNEADSTANNRQS